MKYEQPKLIIATEYRPCYVKGRKALFHRWTEKEKVYYSLNSVLSKEQIEKYIDFFENSMCVPADAKINIVKTLVAVVEYEGGQVAEVSPCEIRFADNQINEYAFNPETE